MSDPEKKRATYQDVLDAPPHKNAEIINGTLHLWPRPGIPHANVASVIGGELYAPFGRGRGGPGGWIILDEPELHFGDDVLIPDLAGWRRERLPHLADVPYFTLPPDWICEVLSRSTEKVDRLEKMPNYAAAGVAHAWLVHPAHRSVEVFRLHDGKWMAIASYTDSVRARIEPFDAIEIDLDALWTDTPLPTRAGEEPGVYAFERHM